MDITTGQPTLQVGGNGMGGDWGIMFLAFLAMMGGGFGGWGGNRGPIGPVPVQTGDQAPVSSAQFQNGMNMQNLADQNRDILGATNNVYHDITANLDSRYAELQRDIAANAIGIQQVQANSQQCCCQIKQEIAAQTLKFSEMLNAQNVLLMQENQKTRDMITVDRFERMQAEINDLKRQRDINAAFRMNQPQVPFPPAIGF